MLKSGEELILTALVICAGARLRERLEQARATALHDCLSALWKRLERAHGIPEGGLAHEIRVCSCMTASPRTLEELTAPFRRLLKTGRAPKGPREMLEKILNELPGERLA